MKALFIVIVLLLVLGGGAWFFVSDKQEGGVTPGEQAIKTGEKQAGTALVSSIKDAMGLGQTMRCTYAITGADAATSTVYVSGQKFKATTKAGSMTSEALFDGETQYVWTSTSPQGMKMSKTCMEDLKKSFPQSGDTSTSVGVSPQDYQETFGMAQNVNCEKVDGVDLSVPTTITFVDQCAMMDQLKGLIPSGTYPGQ